MLVGGLLLTAGVIILALRLIPVTYDVKSSILLLPPQISVEETGGNPFLSLGGLEVVAGVLAKSLTDTDSVESIVPDDGPAEYTIEQDASIDGSVLEVTVSDRTADGAFDTLDAVLALATERLDELQDAVAASDESHVRLMVITNNTVAVPNAAALGRTLIVLTAACLVLTLLLAVFVDAAIRRRRAVSAARTPTDTVDDEPGRPAPIPAMAPTRADRDEEAVLARESP
ncbi:hypothetical protein [Cryobacterium arcticum]|uniref:hypothetical protein n=1 Tax=Cryobacterium arcticum TaxID=670052 RepID=UPI0015E842AC|nr:hypothetical protein [Cryobacterium arcticum]